MCVVFLVTKMSFLRDCDVCCGAFYKDIIPMGLCGVCYGDCYKDVIPTGLCLCVIVCYKDVVPTGL